MTVWCENPARTAALRPSPEPPPAENERADPAACLCPTSPHPVPPHSPLGTAS